jgi:predicted ATP-binding protein involved in virulence
LSTVKRETVRVLSDNYAVEPLAQTYGRSSADVLHSVMSVDPMPDKIPEDVNLKRLTTLIDQGFYDEKEANDLMEALQNRLGIDHPQLSMLRRSIVRQKVLNQ